jgi:hypothetical protein
MTKGNLLHTVNTLDRMIGEPPIMTESWMDSRHIAEWHPARVLREVEARRRTVEQFTMIELPEKSNGDAAVIGAYVKMQAVLRLLALPYADHPDYRPEWAPDA